MSMTPIVSKVTAPSKMVHGLQVLLVESNQDTLQQHVFFLSQNSYRVTSANKLSTGLSMIANGNTFDFVVVDTENFEIDIVQFLHQALKRQPQIPIIVMAWDDLQVLIAKQTRANEGIWFLQKPCGADQICDLLQRVSTRRINFIERASIAKSLNKTSMINNNLSSSDGGHLSQNENSQKHGAMSKSQSYVDISSDDDEPTIKKNICIGRARSIDKGRKPTALRRKNGQSVMDHVHREMGKGISPPTAWTRALHEDYPKANQMSVPGLTSEHVGSHLQTGNYLLDSHSCKSSGLSIPSNNDASMIRKSGNLLSLLKYNAMGTCYINIDKVKAKLRGAPRSYRKQINTTTTINYSGGDQVSDCNFGDPCLPLIGDKSMSNAFGLAENPDNNGTAQGGYQVSNCNFGDPFQPLIDDISMSNAFGLAEGGDQVSNGNFGDPCLPLIGDTSMSNVFGLAENPNSNGTAQGGDQVSNCNFGDPCLPLIGDTSMSNAFGFAENPDINGTAQGGDQASNFNFGDPCLPLIGDTSMSNAFGLVENPDNNATAQGSPSFYLPQPNTATTINYSGGDQVSNCNFGDPFQALIDDISMSHAFGLADNPDNNGTAQGSPSLYPPHQNPTTTINYSGGDQVSNFTSGDTFQPPMGDISTSNAFGLAENPDNNGTAPGSPSLYLPAQLNTTTTINYSGGDQLSNFISGDTFEPPIGDISTSNAFGLAENPDNTTAQCIETFSSNRTLEEAIAPTGVNATIEPDYTSGVDATKFSNCFVNVDYGGAGGSGISETLAQTDRFGIAIDSHGEGDEDSSNLGGVRHTQDFQGNGENLFDVDNSNSMNLSFLNPDSVSFGHASTGFLRPSTVVEENSNQTEIQQHANSIVPVDGSEGKSIVNEWYMMMVRHKSGNPMEK